MNDDWHAFLAQQGADLRDGLVTDFGDPQGEADAAAEAGIVTDLSRFDVLTFSGGDCINFLNNQLTSNINELGVGEHQISSWCNVKGRVIASFLLFRGADHFHLLLERDMAPTLMKRLQMYVLRADVKIENRSSDLVRLGIRGEAARRQLETHTADDAHEILFTRQDPVTRSIVLCTGDTAPGLWRRLTAEARPAGTHHWARGDIDGGIPWVGGAGTGEFLPQSLNLDLLGGLRYDKGCFPGQEIIARMHFRGKLKQRMFLAAAPTGDAPAVKSRIYTDNGTRHRGMVVNAVRSADDACRMLVTLDLDCAGAADLHLGDKDGPAVRLLSLPYDLDH